MAHGPHGEFASKLFVVIAASTGLSLEELTKDWGSPKMKRWHMKIVHKSTPQADGEWRELSDAASEYVTARESQRWVDLDHGKLELPEGYELVALRRDL